MQSESEIVLRGEYYEKVLFDMFNIDPDHISVNWMQQGIDSNGLTD